VPVSDARGPFSDQGPLGGHASAWLAAIIDSSDDAIVSKTLGGVITSWNRGAERIFGYNAAEAIGQRISLIIPRERLPEEDAVLAQIVRGEQVDHFETVRRTKDGRLVDISLTVSPVRDDTGRIIGASKIARDITERRRAEGERDALLARVQEARAEAEALNRGKDEFLATLSHELRTPLNAIFGWARMLTTGQLGADERVRAAEVILRNATAQVQLIDDLFDVARIITGNMRLDLRPVDLRTVVEAALDAVRPALAAKDIRLETALDPRAGPIMGAPDRLQQVIWNLLINAVKFTPKGGRIQVHLRRSDSHAELTVSDTGEGIAPEVLPYIFDRFRQGDTGTSRRHGGLGIGLALARYLVDLHGGSIGADSPGVGLGATFTVRLPIPLAQPALNAPELPPQADAPADGDGGLVALRGVKILVVDDDEDGLEVSRMILTAAGAEVNAHPSTAAALAALESWWPDVLIADIEMPGEDGFALLKKARAMARARNRRLPALALTAYGRAEDRVRILAAGFNLHLAKPVDSSELRMSVASLAGRVG
jgi:PAS domain S-box-containing protein